MNSYQVTFARVGQRTDFPPLTVDGDEYGPTRGALTDAIRAHVWPQLMSDDITVCLDDTARTGTLHVGTRDRGSFTVAAVEVAL